MDLLVKIYVRDFWAGMIKFLKKYKVIIIISLLILVVFVIPYANVLILTHLHGHEFYSITYPVDGAPVYDCKVYSYKKGVEAKVLLVFGNNEMATMDYYEWDNSTGSWKSAEADWIKGKYEKILWDEHGGREFYWPFFYFEEFFVRLFDL